MQYMWKFAPLKISCYTANSKQSKPFAIYISLLDPPLPPISFHVPPLHTFDSPSSLLPSIQFCFRCPRVLMDCRSSRKEHPGDAGEAADLENSVASVPSSRPSLLLCVYVHVCITLPCCLLYMCLAYSSFLAKYWNTVTLSFAIIAPRACAGNPMIFPGSCAKLNVLSNLELICMWKGTLTRKRVLLLQKAEVCIPQVVPFACRSGPCVWRDTPVTWLVFAVNVRL